MRVRRFTLEEERLIMRMVMLFEIIIHSRTMRTKCWLQIHSQIIFLLAIHSLYKTRLGLQKGPIYLTFPLPHPSYPPNSIKKEILFHS